MKKGDLVCYNAVGQKSHTLGIVVDSRITLGSSGEDEIQIKIQWIKRGAYLPKDMNEYAFWQEGFAGYDKYRAMKNGKTPCLWHKTTGIEKVKQ
jgi:hypothetical protein